MPTRGLTRRVLLWAAFLSAPFALLAQSISITVDRTQITIEEQAILSVNVEGANGAQPRLPTLVGFEVTPAGQSTQMTLVNGRRSSSVSYRFELTPLRSGVFEVGVATLEVDGKTHSSKAFKIEVLAASEKPEASRDIFVTSRVSTTKPFVGQQVIHTWRFYRGVQVADARLEPAAFDGFLVEELGEVREYQATVEGRQYIVNEIKRALFPQEVGELVIQPSQLVVQALLQSQSGRRRGFMDDLFSSRSTERRVLREPSIKLDVRPLPAKPTGFGGLVGNFDVSAQMSRRELKVGESSTLKVTVKGSGNSQVISEPDLPELVQFKIYDDRPTGTLNRSGNVLSGSKTYSKALVPLEAGELMVPTIRVTYFDPETESYKVASTEPITLQVAPADGLEDLGLTESLAPMAGKVSVRIMADDILPLHKGMEAAGRTNWLERPLVVGGGLAVPALAYFAALGGLTRRRRFSGDQNLRRRQRARKSAAAKLAALSAAKDEPKVAADVASRCLREFVGDKLGVEGSALTPSEVESLLGEQEVTDVLAAEVTALLRRLEAAQYGASSLSGAELELELEPLIGRLDKELRS